MLICDDYRTQYCVNWDNHLKDCNCLPLCNDIKYKYQIIYKKFKDKAFEYQIGATVRWKDSEFYAMKRYQQFRFVDFLSYLGGILGLSTFGNFLLCDIEIVK